MTAPLARVRTAGAPSIVTSVSSERVPLTLNGTPLPTAKLKSPIVEPLRMPGMSCAM
jgi:hypothetical protein